MTEVYSLHNFLQQKKWIKQEVIHEITQQELLKEKDNRLLITMRSLDWSNRSKKIMTLFWETIKYTNWRGANEWFFFTELNYNKPIVVVYWVTDRLSVLSISKNVIWLWNIHKLQTLLEELERSGVKEVLLLLKNTDSCEKAINKLFTNQKITLDHIYDVRSVLWDYQDINDNIVAWKELTYDILQAHKKSLGDDAQVRSLFVSPGPKWGKGETDYEWFAKHLSWEEKLASIDGSFLQYDTQEWIYKQLHKYDVEGIAVDWCKKILKQDIVTSGNRKSVVEFLCMHSYSSDLQWKLDTVAPLEIALSDGIYDLQNDQLRDYSEEDFKLQKFDYESSLLSWWSYPPQQWISFLGSILEWRDCTQEIYQLLQEFIWYLFVPTTKYEKSLLIHWKWANGKGVLIETIKHLLGDNNYTSIGMHELNKEQNIMLLLWKLVNFDSDLQQSTQLDSWVIKKVISGESITWKQVYQKPLSFRPYTRLIIAANELPYLKSIDDSIRRRFIMLELKQSFVWREDYTLKDTLKEEREQIFAWAMIWLKRLVKRWYFEIPDQLNSSIQKYIDDNDTIQLFLETSELVIKKSWSFSSTRDLYKIFKHFCQESWYRSIGMNKFGNRLEHKWFERHSNGVSRWFKWIHCV